MTTITKCLNEWNVIVEALGNGKQTILIRTYNTNLREFLLYPTISYAKNANVLKSFKKNYYDFVEENLLPNAKGKEYEIKYYAKVEKIVKKSLKSADKFNRHHIWNKKHVNEFIGETNPYFWILRVYRLDNSEFLTRTNGRRYANVNKEVKIDNMAPVLSDEKFNKILNKFD